MAETVFAHILGSLTNTRLLNPTVMVHTTVCPAFLRKTISFT
jgi:hypothetical protein